MNPRTPGVRRPLPPMPQGCTFFTMARLTKREREEIEREEDEWWWISQERKRAEEEAMWAMWDEWDRMERMEH